MAVTVTSVFAAVDTKGRSDDAWGDRRIGLYRVTLQNPYATGGGDPFDPRNFGFQGPLAMVRLSVRYVAGGGMGGRHFIYDFVNKKIFVTNSAGGEVGAIDLSGVKIDVLAIGE